MKYKLGDICKIKSGKRLPKGEVVDTYNTGNKYIRVRDLNNRYIDSNSVQYITQEAAEKIKRYIVRKGDIIISVVGTIGLVSEIPEELDGAYLTENCDNLLINEDICLKKYLKLYLQSPIGQQEINSKIVGSTQPKLPIYGIEDITVDVPSISVQHKIINILDKIEKKIQINNKINDNLQKLGTNIFNKQFEDLEDLPSGWKYDVLGNYISIERGLSYKGKYLSNNGIPMVNLGNIMPNGVFRIEKNKFYTGEYKEKVTTKEGDIVIANTDMTQDRAVIGSPVIIPPIYDNKVIFSHHVYGVKNIKLPKMYIFYNLLSKRYKNIVAGTATGTTVLALPKDVIENYEIIIPDKETLEKFESVASSIQKKKDGILLENIKLEQLRDMLLPQLMNGEVDLDKIET